MDLPNWYGIQYRKTRGKSDLKKTRARVVTQKTRPRAVPSNMSVLREVAHESRTGQRPSYSIRFRKQH